MLMESASLFREVRAADILYHSGYPLDGFSLLRDVRDRAIFLAAVGSGQVTLRQLAGYESNAQVPPKLTEEMWLDMRQRAKRLERDLLRRVIGSESGLAPATQQELKGWTELFQLEVHGSRLTRSAEFREWITGTIGLPLIPKPREWALAVYANRFVEVCWMVLSVLPLLQLTPYAFGTDWAQRWVVLDESFRHDAEDLWRMGKPIEGAIIHMVDTKFAFSPANHYTDT
jgi:hypothetical protein